MTDYLTDFVQESEERITELNNALLTLERDPDDEEAMENIFRIAHTLKGNCGAMGLESASDLAHAIEDLLDAVRGNDLEVTPELMDVVFDAVDELETMIDEVAADGAIETDPSATISALRDHLAAADGAAGIGTPTSSELDDICSRFDPPANEEHDAYLTRLAIAEREDVNNGKLVVEALIDAFDLIGTDPPRETIEADEYGSSFDAVFATAVGEAAIASGLEPVEEVADFEIVDVTDRFDDDAEPAEQSAAAAEPEPGEDISPDEAQDLEVDELLDEFDEFDDLDEMVEEVDDEELEAFENMGEAGSFDDLLDEEDVAELDAEPGEPPTDSVGDVAESESDAHDGPSDGTAAADAEAESEPGDEDDEVEDASAVFNELKDEVEMVGFDELQDELEELEFDEFDDEEEVDMDELLGDDVADDDAFLEGPEPTEGAVDDLLVESEPDDADDETPDADADAEAATAETSAESDDEAPLSAEDDFESIADDLESTDDTAVAVDDGEPDDLEPADSSDVAAEAGDSFAEMATDEVVEFDAGDDVDETDEADAVDEVDETGDVDETDEVGEVDDTDRGDGEAGDANPDTGTEDAAPPIDSDSVDDATAMPSTVDVESDVDSVADDGEGDDDGIETDAVDADTTDAADAEPDESLEDDEAVDGEPLEDPAASESFGAGVEDDFGSTPAVDADLERAGDDTDPFDDDPDPFDDEFSAVSDDGFDEPATDPVDLDADVEDDFDDGFDDSLDEQPADEAFAEPDEFDVGETDFDSPTADVEMDVGVEMESATSFGDESADGDDGDDEEDVERILEEPEMEIPDLTVPESTDRPDADAETDEIQSVRVDVEQIDSLLTLVEGLVTSRVRLRHAADADDDGTALEKELDALSDLTTDLQETVMDIRLVPLRTVTSRLPRVVRDIARDQDKEVDFEMIGEDVELDRSILDRIGDPLIHLVRNAVDHGIEPPAEREDVGKPREGTVEVHADRSRDRVTITVEDDGSGLDPDRLRSEAVAAGIVDESEAESMSDEAAYDLIFHPGLSTADEVTDVSGRGVGMDVVKRTVEDLDGTVSIDSDRGDGTTVTMTLPVTVAIDEILFLESGGEEFGVPTKAVRDIEPATAVETAGGESVLPGEDRDYPVIRLADVLETPAPGRNGDGMVVRIRDEVREVALHCDHVHGQQEVVVKPFEGFMSDIPGLSGATVRGRGEVVNILDVTTL